MENALDQLKSLAEGIGFESFGPAAMDSLVPLEEVRAMCSSGNCKKYGTSWSCPPAIGGLDWAAKRIGSFSQGLLVQTTAAMEDDFDMEAIRKAMELHKKRFDTLVRQLKALDLQFLAMGAGTCTRCYRCTYPENSCRYPDKLIYSMEAYGLLVSRVCTQSGLAYNHGPSTITYTSCILI